MSADKVKELRAEAERYTRDSDPVVRYLAGWLVFYMDAHASAMQAWQDSIDKIGTA